MKKLILGFAAIAITAGAYAQTDSTNRKMSMLDMNNVQNENVRDNPIDKSYPDGVMMQNGKIMMVKNGQTTILDHDMTMSNGTKISSNGTYIKKNGTEMMMKEGQHMGMSGKMVTMKKDKDDNLYLFPDSTMHKE